MLLIERLLEHWHMYYYTNLLLLLTEVIALLSLLHYKKKGTLKNIFALYIGTELTLLILDQIILSSPQFSFRFAYYFLNISNTLISLVELAAYYYFFNIFFNNKKITRLLAILFILFLTITIVFLITKFSFISKRLNYISNVISVIEFSLILLPCFLYYLSIINTASEVRLFKRPSFWLVTGIFFFATISIPHYLIGPFYISNNVELKSLLIASFLFFPFSINFIFLTKAFLCKKTLTI